MSKQIETLNRYLYQQTQLLDHLPVAISIKDVQLQYRYFNTQALEQAGFKQLSDVFEKSDTQMPWFDQAAIFQQGGRKVLSGMKLLTLDPIITQDNRSLTYLTQQTPIVDLAGEIIGISLTTRIIAHHKLVNNSRYVTAQDKSQLADLILPHLSPMRQFSHDLTEKEKMTLYYILQGATIEEIAVKLSRSSYTIKDRVTRLKQIFNCETKAALIQKAIAEGYRQCVPQSLRV